MSEDNSNNNVYTHAFYESQSSGSLHSAREVVPLVLKCLPVKSVVDIGCGVGSWLSIFKENGIHKYLGIDGDYVDPKMLMIEPEKFMSHNLSQELLISQTFDLAISLEVAEHIPEDKSHVFIKTLTSLSPIILFSAAIPLQGGKGHLNEQWPEYWIKKFREYEYVPVDCLRKKIWNNNNVQAWYKQNLFFLVKESDLSKYPNLSEDFTVSETFLGSGIVHPQIYLNSIAFNKTQSAYIDPLKLSRIILPLVEGKYSQSDIESFQEIRYQIAKLWLNISDELLPLIYTSDVGKAHKLLRSNFKKKYYSYVSDKEKSFINEILSQLQFIKQSSNQILLVCMLYLKADEIECLTTISEIPNWLLPDYTQYILDTPSIFTQKGEIEIFHQRIKKYIHEVYNGICHQPESQFWIEASRLLAQNLKCIPLYFTTDNLKELYIKRASILEFYLSSVGFQIDYSFDSPRTSNKIRVGILLPSLGAYAQAFGTIPSFEHLNREKFEIHVYVSQRTNSSVESYCKSRVDRIAMLSGKLGEDAKAIREDDLDILVIGSNVTAVVNQITLLALHRLARSQCHLIRSPVTSGMRHADFYISGRLSEPESIAQEHYRETLIQLDGTGLCFNYSFAESKTLSTSMLTREALNIPQNSVVFISGSNFYKVIPELRETWSKILENVQNSVLLLYPFAPSWSNAYPKEEFLESMRHYLELYQVAVDRLVVLDALPNRNDVKEYLKLGDIYLDAFPHSGSHSIIDALEVGLPVITCEGSNLRAKHGAGILREVSLDDLVAHDEMSYIQCATKLAHDLELRRSIHQRIQESMLSNPRFLDVHDYARQLEGVFCQIVDTYASRVLSQSLSLRQFNVITFPDWNQVECELGQDLYSVVKVLSQHPDRHMLTLLIASDGISAEDAEIFLSSVAMEMLMTENMVDIADLQITVVDHLDDSEWVSLAEYLSCQISLAQGSQPTNPIQNLATIPTFEIDEIARISFNNFLD